MMESVGHLLWRSGVLVNPPVNWWVNENQLSADFFCLVFYDHITKLGYLFS
jgi:hypothetical protein